MKLAIAITIIVDVHDDAFLANVNGLAEALATQALGFSAVRAVVSKSGTLIPGPVCRPLAKAGAR